MKRKTKYWRSAFTLVGLVFGFMVLTIKVAFIPLRESYAQESLEQESSTIERLRLVDDSAIGFFESVDATGCIQTSASVLGGTQRQHEPPGPPGDLVLGAVLVLHQFDFCQGNLLRLAVGGTNENVEFRSSPDLNTATLIATIPMFDFIQGHSFDATVNVIWTGTGSLDLDQSTTVSHEAGFLTKLAMTGTLRPAEASGTVIAGDENFTPEPSVEGQIQRVRSGSLVVQQMGKAP